MSDSPQADGPGATRRALRTYAAAAVSGFLLLIFFVRSGEPARPRATAAVASEPVQYVSIPDTYQAQFSYCMQQVPVAPQQALPACERAVALDPQNLTARHNLGYAYRVVGRLDLAIETLEGVARERPENTRTLFELASAYADAGRIEEASDRFLAVIALEPSHGFAQQRLQALEQQRVAAGAAAAPAR
jgi:tetratricopeptide (TPR) repeat protein